MPAAGSSKSTQPYDPSHYVARSHEERLALESLAQSRVAFVEGPVRAGKSWFVRCLGEALSQECPVRLAAVNCAELPADAELDELYELIAVQVVHTLDGPPAWLQAMRQSPLTGSRRLTKLMTGHVLPSQDGLLVLAFSQIDDFASTRCGDELFGLLRSWASLPSLLSLRVVVEAESLRGPELERTYLYYYRNQVISPVRLQPFGPAQAAELAAHHGLAWRGEAVERLVEHLGGHPYLLRLAAIAGAEQGLDPDTLVKEGVARGVFADHLNPLRDALGDEALRRAAKEVAASMRSHLREGPYLRLERLGLVTRDARDKPPRLSAPIYHHLVGGTR